MKTCIENHFRLQHALISAFGSLQVSDYERLEFILEGVPHVHGQEQHLLLDLIRPACEQSATYDFQGPSIILPCSPYMACIEIKCASCSVSVCAFCCGLAEGDTHVDAGSNKSNVLLICSGSCSIHRQLLTRLCNKRLYNHQFGPP